MFGFGKIRAWMDIRTKKTKNKSKHNSGMGRDGGSSGGFSSPTLIRRSEISPLQSTNGGRAGWKTPDSPGHGKIESSSSVSGKRTVSVNFSNGDDRHRFNYRSEDVKKVIIQARPHSKRNTVAESKHYSHSSGTSEFGSVMNYISSPESAYSTGYSTLHSDDCLSPATTAAAATRPPPEFYVNSRNGMQYTPSFQLANDDALVTASIPYVDSPSPRQRSRIRTNPWYKTQATNNSLMPHSGGSTTTTPSLSSSYQEQRPRSNCSSPSKPYFNGCDIHIPVKSKFNISPNTLRKRKLIEPPTTDYYYKAATTAATTDSLDSLNEDDSTLKEIMGKFEDISYTYDKETDILSDSSDHTQCQEEHSDFEDTGQEAEDEYEEEIDFIDKHAVSVAESIKYKNMGSCEYYEEKEKQEVELPQPQPQQISRASLKQRKRLRRTRKRSECSTPGPGSAVEQSRECRSVGGTPILNRRAAKLQASQIIISDRSNSLNTLSSPQKTLITIAESEKALLKSDLEAFIKYRELITEAETLLGSFKPATHGPTPASPVPPHRNNPPHLPNKRVEMLRGTEVSKRSDVLNHHNSSGQNVRPAKHSCLNLKPHSPLPVNKKIELLKQEQYAFGPPPPQPNKVSKENHPPPANFNLPRRMQTATCPNSEPLKRKVYVPSKDSVHYHQELFLRGSGGNLKQEMILKTLEDLKRSLEDQKTQLYTLNEKP